ncbi:MAG: O-antigen ligase family protein [Endomicrobiales bacterium]|nr:O-antigen ligase family protein [Endomicrobiales bacterium]
MDKLSKIKVNYNLVVLLVISMILFSRNFAHLSVNTGMLSVYTTELALIIVVAVFLMRALILGKVKYLKHPLLPWFAALYAVMFFSLCRGFIDYNDRIFVLRQSSLFYYSLFFFIMPLFVDNIKKVKILFKWYVYSCVVISVAILLKITFYGLGHYGYYYLGMAIAALCYLIATKRKKSVIFGILVLIFFMAFIKGMARASWVGLLCAMLAIYWLNARKLIRIVTIKRTFYSLIVIVALVTCAMAIVSPKSVERIMSKALSIAMVQTEESTNRGAILNAKWRLLVWKDIINESMRKPLLGWGFGKKFVPETVKSMGWGGAFRDEEVGFQDPHNSFLSVLHRTGIVGFTIFAVILGKFLRRTFLMLGKMREGEIKDYVAILFLCVIYMLATSFFMVVLEGPYLGIFLWIAMGLVVSLERIYESQEYASESK